MTDERLSHRRPGVEASVRTAAIWATVAEHASRRQAELDRPLTVLDLGGGSGGLAVPLALEGHEVIVVDPSPDALASLRRRAAETDASHLITARQGDADSLKALLDGRAVDLVTCHGTLEHVDDPESTVARLAEVLAPGGLLSLVTTQRLAAVLSRALAGAFDKARTALSSPDGRWGADDPVPHRFDSDEVLALVRAAGLAVVDTHPVRIFTDLAPSAALDSEADRHALLALEEAAAAHPALTSLASALHVVAARP